MMNCSGLKPLFMGAVLLLTTACGEVSVSSENRFQVVDLPDNSVVYMNKDCKISYPEDFKSDRIIKLSGEAYFNVAQGSHPFIIETKAGKIVIKGTKLNVKTGLADQKLGVEVDEGKVEVEALNEKVIVKEGEKLIVFDNELKKIKADKAFSKWINQLEQELYPLGKAIDKGRKVLKNEGEKAEEKIRKMFK